MVQTFIHSLTRYWKQRLRELDYDELVYGHDKLSEISEKHPSCSGNTIINTLLYLSLLFLTDTTSQLWYRRNNPILIQHNYEADGNS